MPPVRGRSERAQSRRIDQKPAGQSASLSSLTISAPYREPNSATDPAAIWDTRSPFRKPNIRRSQLETQVRASASSLFVKALTSPGMRWPKMSTECRSHSLLVTMATLSQRV